MDRRFDGVRFITDEGYVLTHVLPLGYDALPLSQQTVTGSPIRVFLYRNPVSEGEEETLVEIGVIPWAELIGSAPLKVILGEMSFQAFPISVEAYEEVLNNPQEASKAGG